MKRVSLGRLLLAAVATFATYIVTEAVIENLVYLISGVSEGELRSGRPGVTLSGLRHQIVSLSIFLAVCVVIMSVYALIRPNLRSPGQTVTATIAVTLAFFFLLFGNFVNMGVLTVEMMLLSFAFNLIETPVAILAGAGVYERGMKDVSTA
jgi:hypothetical protein